MTTTEIITKETDSFASRLMEHADSVQIFITFHEGGKEITKSYEKGEGNFYTRYGQITEWIFLQEQHARNWCNKRGF